MANALGNPLLDDDSGLSNGLDSLREFTGETYQDVLDWFAETGRSTESGTAEYRISVIEQALEGMEQDDNGHYYNGNGDRVYVFRDPAELGDDSGGYAAQNLVMRTEKEIRDAFNANQGMGYFKEANPHLTADDYVNFISSIDDMYASGQFTLNSENELYHHKEIGRGPNSERIRAILLEEEQRRSQLRREAVGTLRDAFGIKGSYQNSDGDIFQWNGANYTKTHKVDDSFDAGGLIMNLAISAMTAGAGGYLANILGPALGVSPALAKTLITSAVQIAKDGEVNLSTAFNLAGANVLPGGNEMITASEIAQDAIDSVVSIITDPNSYKNNNNGTVEIVWGANGGSDGSDGVTVTIPDYTVDRDKDSGGGAPASSSTATTSTATTSPSSSSPTDASSTASNSSSSANAGNNSNSSTSTSSSQGGTPSGGTYEGKVLTNKKYGDYEWDDRPEIWGENNEYDGWVLVSNTGIYGKSGKSIVYQPSTGWYNELDWENGTYSQEMSDNPENPSESNPYEPSSSSNSSSTSNSSTTSSTPTPKPGDACTLSDGSAGTIDGEGACQPSSGTSTSPYISTVGDLVWANPDPYLNGAEDGTAKETSNESSDATATTSTPSTSTTSTTSSTPSTNTTSTSTTPSTSTSTTASTNSSNTTGTSQGPGNGSDDGPGDSSGNPGDGESGMLGGAIPGLRSGSKDSWSPLFPGYQFRKFNKGRGNKMGAPVANTPNFQAREDLVNSLWKEVMKR